VRLDHLLSKEPLAASRAVRLLIEADSRSVALALVVREARTRVVPLRGEPGSDRTDGETRCSALRVRALEHLENSIASASIYSQVKKGLRWMPWRQEPMKDASGCEKLRGAAERALIRRCPNGETRPGSCPVTRR
jgi:hypothetical protein